MIDLTYLTINKVRRFLHKKKYPGGASIHRIDKLFPLKPSLVLVATSFNRRNLLIASNLSFPSCAG